MVARDSKFEQDNNNKGGMSFSVTGQWLQFTREHSLSGALLLILTCAGDDDR